MLFCFCILKTPYWTKNFLTAFRLGGHGVQSEQVGGTSTTADSTRQQAPIVVRLVLWTNGFSVNDGPLRQFLDPQNREFLQAVMTKSIPPELIVPGREIDLRIEKKSTEYEPPKIKPFSGKGNQLGSVAPNVENSSDVVYVDAPPKLSAEESAKLVEQAQANITPTFGVTAVAVKGKKCVVIGVAKESFSTLQDERTIRKIHALDSHVMVAFAGLSANARVLIDCARQLAAKNTTTLLGILRYLNNSRISMLVAGFDPDGTPRLFQTGSTAGYYELLAGSVGRNEKVVKEYLQKEYSNEKTANEEDTLKLMIKSLSAVVQSGPQNIEIAVIKWVDGSNGQPAHCEQRILSVEMIGALLNQIESEQQQPTVILNQK